MRRNVLSLAVVAAFLGLAAGSTDTDQSGSVSSAPAPPAPPSREEVASQNVHLIKFDWSTGGFDTVMIATFTVKNFNDFAVKDITISCKNFGNSGTEIGENTQTIYEVIKPNKKCTFREVNMGFIQSQVASSRCRVTGVVPD